MTKSGSTKISVKDFKKRIREDMDRIGADNAWDITKESERGYAFQLWAAGLFTGYEDRFDTEPEESIQFSNDLGADLVLEDTSAGHLLIVQCKFASLSQRVNTEENQVNDFFARHELYMDREWVLAHASERAASLLSDYSEKINAGCSVTYRFVTTSYASDRVKGVEKNFNNRYENDGLSVTCELMDFNELKDYYVRAASLELSIPDEVTFPIQPDLSFQRETPYPTLIASVKGNVLRDLSKQHKQSLLAYNIRGYLGGVGINSGIRETADKDPEKFFYFNNGVSAVCTDFKVSDNMVVAKDFQIINGAQTVGSLRHAHPSSELEILLRLTKTESVKTIKGFNRDIIRFNNTQNVIKVSDFRSNDPIQLWLQEKFNSTNARGPLPKLRYLRRREVGGGRGVGTGIRLEELAKIRFAFLFEPTAVHEAPKSLWTHGEDGGLYEKAFGIDGDLVESWSDADFQETLVAVAFYLRIVERTTELGKSEPSLKYLKRLRFHILALSGAYVRKAYPEGGSLNLCRSESEFDEAWKNFFEAACDSIDIGYQRVNDQELTMSAFLRSRVEWDRTLSFFSRKISRRRASS